MHADARPADDLPCRAAVFAPLQPAHEDRDAFPSTGAITYRSDTLPVPAMGRKHRSQGSTKRDSRISHPVMRLLRTGGLACHALRPSAGTCLAVTCWQASRSPAAAFATNSGAGTGTQWGLLS